MPTFTDGELDVMRILWKHGEMKPTEIQQKFPREIKNSALRSYLSILLEKAHVRRQRRGKAYYYTAATKQESAFRSMLRRLADAFCNGSTEALLCRLIKEEHLTEEELVRLRRLVDEHTQGSRDK